MRKIVTGAFVSLDGVMQAPGGPEEDPTGGFKFGGWMFPYFDETLAAAMGESFSTPYELLLGRRTYDIFAAHWPHVTTDPEAKGYDAGEAEIARQFNSIKKHVATHRPDSLTWKNSEWLGPDAVAKLRELKKKDGPILLTQGSSELVRLLLEQDLVDELRLLIFPVVLGRGKRLFGERSHPGAFELAGSKTSPSGVVVATYRRAGEVRLGSFALKEPSPAELERRKSLR